MRIKKFVGRQSSAILQRIKEEMGEDAMILATRQSPDGRIEISAAAEGQHRVAPKAMADTPRPGFQRVTASPSESSELSIDRDIVALKEEIAHLRRSVQSVLTEPRIDFDRDMPPIVAALYRRLYRNGIDDVLLEDIMLRLSRLVSPTGTVPSAEFRKIFSEVIGDTIRTSGPIGENGVRHVVFVGPPGVGKSTTVSKLAARHLARGKTVAIVALSDPRIPMGDMLGKIAKLIGVPYALAGTRGDLTEQLGKFRDLDMVLIDAYGESPGDSEGMVRLTELLDQPVNLERHLVLPATATERYLVSVGERYHECGFDRLLITKTDEEQRFGSMVNSIVRLKTPLSYLSTGRRIPQDIRVVTISDLLGLLLNGQLLQ